MRNSNGSLLKIAEFSLGFETFAKIVRIRDIQVCLESDCTLKILKLAFFFVHFRRRFHVFKVETSDLLKRGATDAQLGCGEHAVYTKF